MLADDAGQHSGPRHGPVDLAHHNVLSLQQRELRSGLLVVQAGQTTMHAQQCWGEKLVKTRSQSTMEHIGQTIAHNNKYVHHMKAGEDADSEGSGNTKT